MKDQSDPRKKSRSMNLWSATSIGVGAMIGAGIFALIGIAVDIAGKFAFLSFILAGIIALFTTYSVSRLAVQFPSKGGRVEYLNKAFGTGVLSGSLNIIMWIGYIIVTSLYARAFGEYGVALFGLGEDPLWLHILSSSVVLLFVLINFIGANVVGNTELFIVAVKVLVLLLFGVLGLTTIQPQNIDLAGSFDLSGIILAGGIVFMSYEGFGLVANTAEDIQKPKKNLPRALYISVILVMLIYVLVSIAVIGNLSVDEILSAKEYALAEAAKPVMGSLGFTIMGIAALFSTASAINATIYGPVNMLQETARAGQVSSFFTRSLFGHQSGNALLITGAIILIAANTLDLEAIAETGSLIFLIIYCMVNVANLKLRGQTHSKAWLIWLGILGTAFAFFALVYFQLNEKSMSVYILGAILVFGFLYEWAHQRHKYRDDKRRR